MESCPSGRRSWSRKPVYPLGTEGSNPSLSAEKHNLCGYCVPKSCQVATGSLFFMYLSDSCPLPHPSLPVQNRSAMYPLFQRDCSMAFSKSRCTYRFAVRFSTTGDRVEYIFSCDADFYIRMFGRQYPTITRHIELTGFHNTKF